MKEQKRIQLIGHIESTRILNEKKFKSAKKMLQGIYPEAVIADPFEFINKPELVHNNQKQIYFEYIKYIVQSMIDKNINYIFDVDIYENEDDVKRPNEKKILRAFAKDFGIKELLKDKKTIQEIVEAAKPNI